MSADNWSVCPQVKLPGIQSIIGHNGDGRVIVRWKGDDESDYEVHRPNPLLCLLVITRLGRRVDPDEGDLVHSLP